MSNLKSLMKNLEAARNQVRREAYGTDAFEAAMKIVRALVDQVNAAQPKEEFCSVDSGFHRTRLANGRVI